MKRRTKAPEPTPLKLGDIVQLTSDGDAYIVAQPAANFRCAINLRTGVHFAEAARVHRPRVRILPPSTIPHYLILGTCASAAPPRLLRRLGEDDCYPVWKNINRPPHNLYRVPLSGAPAVSVGQILYLQNESSYYILASTPPFGHRLISLHNGNRFSDSWPAAHWRSGDPGHTVGPISRQFLCVPNPFYPERTEP